MLDAGPALRSDAAMNAAVFAHFRQQIAACRNLGSPFTATVLETALSRLQQASPPAWTFALLGWHGDPQADALALRLAGALHRIVRDGDAALAAAYAAQRIDAALIDAALARHGDVLAQYLQSAPQTNEPQRSAMLLGGFLVIAAETGRPLACREIGASAGLNLLWPDYACDFGDWRYGDPDTAPLILQAGWSGPRPPQAQILLHSRAGCDRAPLDAGNAADRERLLSYVWADQTARLQRIAAALDHAAGQAVTPLQKDAGDFVEAQLASKPADAAFVLYHSIVWQYLPADEKQCITRAMQQAGSIATENAPLAWLRLEAGAAADGAELVLTLWRGDGRAAETRLLGIGDYHGRWMRWHG